jgi:hypothetical protein
VAGYTDAPPSNADPATDAPAYGMMGRNVTAEPVEPEQLAAARHTA